MVLTPTNIEWEKASTLGETIVRLVKEKKTESEEFKALLAYYGRPRIVQLYKEELSKDKGKPCVK